MINNFNQIKHLLNFESENDFYFLQIIKRKKENPEIGSNNLVVATYYIKSREHLDNIEEEAIMLANFHKARVCINLNKRNFEKAAFQMLKKVTDCVINKDYKAVRKAYNSVCGAYSYDENKTWIIDIDTKDDLRFYVAEFIRTLRPCEKESKVVTYIETKNGWHIISKPFEVNKFKEKYPDIEVHKDNPTILYIP